MLIIQAVAALLLLLGTWLIFRALLEIDASERRKVISRPHRLSASSDSDADLPRAA